MHSCISKVYAGGVNKGAKITCVEGSGSTTTTVRSAATQHSEEWTLWLAVCGQQDLAPCYSRQIVLSVRLSVFSLSFFCIGCDDDGFINSQAASYRPLLLSCVNGGLMNSQAAYVHLHLILSSCLFHSTFFLVVTLMAASLTGSSRSPPYCPPSLSSCLFAPTFFCICCDVNGGLSN